MVALVKTGDMAGVGYMGGDVSIGLTGRGRWVETWEEGEYYSGCILVSEAMEVSSIVDSSMVYSSGVAALESTHHRLGKAWRVETETETAELGPTLERSEFTPPPHHQQYLGEKGPIAID
jgi:hypothetical protein